MKGLEGKKALVTGGTKGIGLSIANRLVTEGCDVVVTGRSKPEVLGDRSFFSVDFSKEDSLKGLLNFTSSSNFDILINNAGINKIEPVSEIKPETFANIHQVNLNAPFLLTQKVLKHMTHSGWGRIVNIGSIFGIISKEYRTSYSTSKYALDGLTASVAAEVASKGVLVNTVAPGFIETQLTRSILSEREIDQLTKQVPQRRLGKPEEIAALVAFMVSAENSFISGQCITIDGGFTRV